MQSQATHSPHSRTSDKLCVEMPELITCFIPLDANIGGSFASDAEERWPRTDMMSSSALVPNIRSQPSRVNRVITGSRSASNSLAAVALFSFCFRSCSSTWRRLVSSFSAARALRSSGRPLCKRVVSKHQTPFPQCTSVQLAGSKTRFDSLRTMIAQCEVQYGRPGRVTGNKTKQRIGSSHLEPIDELGARKVATCPCDERTACPELFVVRP